MLWVSLLFLCPAVARLSVEFDDDGGVNLLRNGQVWLSPSGGPELHSSGAWQNLTLLKITKDYGMDKVGSFSQTIFHWGSANKTKEVLLETSSRTYPALGDIVTFGTRFPLGANDTSLGQGFDVVEKLLMSKFPKWKIPQNFDWISSRFQWDDRLAGGDFPGGLYGGVPVLIFNRDEHLPGIVLSPLNNFAVGWQVNMTWGLHGRVSSVPANFEFRVLAIETEGIRNGFRRWGDLMLRVYDKARPNHRDDPIASNLAYYMDTGSFYWYNPLQNYEHTLKKLKSALTVPVVGFNFDSWFYYKYPNSSVEQGGIKLWASRPDVFPSGMDFVVDRVLERAPIIAHSKYYGAENDYLSQYKFLVAKNKQLAIPDSDPSFWKAIFANATHWGVKVFEIDWLESLYEFAPEPSENVFAISIFLNEMSAAAKEANIKIQYCMPVASSYLSSLESGEAVTRIRASNDYSTDVNQWRIGRSAIVNWAIGLLSSKDAFWSSEIMPGSPYGNFSEPNSALNAAVATLSCAGVAIGDEIGHTNRSLVLSTCRSDGRTLSPDEPAMAIDRSFTELLDGGEVYSTFSKVGNHVFFYILAANLSQPFEIAHSDIGASAETSFFAHDWSDPEGQPFLLKAPLQLKLPACGTQDFHLFVLSPIPLLGERSKFVSLSSVRFKSISEDEAEILLAPYEQLSISVFGRPDLKLENQENRETLKKIKLF